MLSKLKILIHPYAIYNCNIIVNAFFNSFIIFQFETCIIETDNRCTIILRDFDACLGKCDDKEHVSTYTRVTGILQRLIIPF